MSEDASASWGLGTNATLECLSKTVVHGSLLPQASTECGMDLRFWVYLLASQKNGTLYCGSTDDLARRVFAHREGRGSAFTRKYHVYLLVWCEAHETREAAKAREYRIKSWRRAWKIELIEAENPNWDDIFLRLNQ